MEDPGVMERIDDILNNLHLDENAYITVFLMHHSKNIRIINKIESIASSLFDECEPITLDKDEMSFFDDQVHNIVNAVLPPDNVTAEMERTRRLKIQDENEKPFNDDSDEEQNEELQTFLNDFRKTIKTAEVMGSIIRNRAGSLEKDKLQNIFSDGVNVHLRMLSYIIERIKGEDEQKQMIEYITKRLSRLDERKPESQRLSEERKRKFAHEIFWNTNFFIIFGIVYKIIHSLGSDKLIEISNHVCDEIDNPVSVLIKHGILMRYQKNLQVEPLHKRIIQDDFSKIAVKAAKLLVVNHCSIHNVDYQKKQQIANTLNISIARLK
jgi:hypothetical protein